jgi:hypothetical protein
LQGKDRLGQTSGSSMSGGSGGSANGTMNIQVMSRQILRSHPPVYVSKAWD